MVQEENGGYVKWEDVKYLTEEFKLSNNQMDNLVDEIDDTAGFLIKAATLK